MMVSSCLRKENNDRRIELIPHVMIDSIEKSLSTFAAEMATTSMILGRLGLGDLTNLKLMWDTLGLATDQSLVLLDEVRYLHFLPIITLQIDDADRPFCSLVVEPPQQRESAFVKRSRKSSFEERYEHS